MDRDDKIFNLQLTIQKLEEELTLYRNGTSGQQLLELIAEKDSEITTLKSTVNEKNDKLRQLARSSNEFLIKHQALQNEKQNLESNIIELNNIITNLKNIIDQNSTKINNQQNRIQNLENKSNILEEELIERTNDVEKLQVRCASLVTEKSVQQKQFSKEKAEKMKQIKEYREELEQSIKFNTGYTLTNILQ